MGYLAVLRRYDGVTERNVQEYVLGALCQGPCVADGASAYGEFEQGLYRELRAGRAEDDRVVGREETDYLAQVLSAAAGDEDAGLPVFFLGHDGFSRQAYEHVYDLLGPTGRRCLGISWSLATLLPTKRELRAADQAEYTGAVDAVGTESASELPAMPVDRLPALPEDGLPEWPDDAPPGTPRDSPYCEPARGASCGTAVVRADG